VNISFLHFPKSFISGSETNTVHLYQREISRPLLSYKFDEQNNGAAKTVTTTTVIMKDVLRVFFSMSLI